jgi:uncharacterized protein (DUF1810 family)
MDDVYDLERYVQAQDPVFASVCAELAAGRKQSHWMWFVFPQPQGLGSSPMAERYAIGSLEEASAYLAHPLLGERLRQCTQLVNRVEGRSAQAIFGYPDYLKFRSCMTLFACVAAQAMPGYGTGHGGPAGNAGVNAVFGEALAKYYAGEADPRTCQLLGQTEASR